MSKEKLSVNIGHDSNCFNYTLKRFYQPLILHVSFNGNPNVKLINPLNEVQSRMRMPCFSILFFISVAVKPDLRMSMKKKFASGAENLNDPNFSNSPCNHAFSFLISSRVTLKVLFILQCSDSSRLRQTVNIPRNLCTRQHIDDFFVGDAVTYPQAS